MQEKPSSTSARSDQKFLIGLIVASLLLAALPFIIGMASSPAGGMYLGYQYNTDDHMVYAAWMRQAMDGRFLMDNRFTTDVQPSLTVNLYFFALGLLAKATGIAVASTLARLIFSGLFVVLAYRLIQRMQLEPIVERLSAIFVVVGGGIGFLVWHMFGVVIVKPAPPVIGDLLGIHLPTDVWQPEGFVFPSMLTNGLFMVSLCLILVALTSLLDAEKSWKPVLPGAASLLVLMNMHSYDVLIIALVMTGFLATALMKKRATKDWILRSAAIALGAVPSALWFAHVYKTDPVFQARAATDTPSANFRAVLAGYGIMMALSLTGLAMRPTENEDQRKRRLIGVGVASALFLLMFIAAGSTPADGQKAVYFLSAGPWFLTLVAAVASTALLADENPTWNLFISWALVGTVAIYFPGLFQRKLAMGLSVPWAVLSAYGLSLILAKQEKTVKTLGTALACILLGASSLRWLSRELQFIQTNTSRTSVQPVFLDEEETKIVSFLNGLKGRHVVVAPPGIPSLAFNKDGDQESGKVSIEPQIPDLNPILSGLAGVYTYAGHWSETPNYDKRRADVQKLLFGKIPDEERLALLKTIGADYVVALNPEAFPKDNLYDFRKLGTVEVTGKRFLLIHVR